MKNFIVSAGKLVTVSSHGTIMNGAMVIQDGKIVDIGLSSEIRRKYPSLFVFDLQEYVISPSLVDCHTHLLEFAPPSLFPITNETHLLAGKSILLNALSCGITALGEQICGSPVFDGNMHDLKKAVKDVPLHTSFAATSISIGFQQLTHFTSITGSKSVQREDLVKKEIIHLLAEESDYPGENIFINATPANFTKDEVPLAGEIIYSQEELNEIVSIFHSKLKKIGTHVAGHKGIEMALNAGFDVLHHAHGIMETQIERASKQEVQIVATPLGGTHLPPNSVEDVMKMLKANITVAVSTDAYLPSHEKIENFPIEVRGLNGPETLMAIAHPFMVKMCESGYDENDALALLTLNPAKVLGKDSQFGSLSIGKDANFVVSGGVPGLEIYNPENIKMVFFLGKKVISRI